MGFLEGFLVGRETANGNSNRGSSGIITNVLFILMIFGIYRWFENLAIAKFSGYFNELIITYILMSILLYRYSYNSGRRSISIDLIDLILMFINLILCTILGFVLFNKIGNTPFNFLVEYWNVLEWGTHNSFAEVSGEIVWLILKALHIICKPCGLLILQYISTNIIRCIIIRRK